MSTKEQVLALLEQNRGRSISGEAIAGQLRLTRNAVWKAVRELEKGGYQIRAVPNKGYCLCENNDILSVQGMLPFLWQKESAGRISVHASLQSTNKTAKEMAMAGAEHGTTVVADCQTAGMGRYSRSFYSPPGHGVYMSLVLHPARLGFETPTLVTVLAAVAVCEAVEAVSGKEPQIKWVNDIYLDGKKICGILTEAVTDFESGNIQWIVAGIGVNFSTPAAAFPPELRPTVGAVFAQGNPPTTRNRLAAEIVNRMVAENRHTGGELIDRYKQRLMLVGERVLLTGAHGTCEAVILDVDAAGRLIVKKDGGNIFALSAGEIRVRP